MREALVDDFGATVEEIRQRVKSERGAASALQTASQLRFEDQLALDTTLSRNRVREIPSRGLRSHPSAQRLERASSKAVSPAALRLSTTRSRRTRQDRRQAHPRRGSLGHAVARVVLLEGLSCRS